MIAEPVALVLACALDAAIGDPGWLPHPVRLIGRLIDRAESVLRPGSNDLKRDGMVLAALVLSVTGVTAYLAESLLLSPSLGKAAGPIAALVYIWLVSTTLALKGLMDSVREVFNEEDIEAAREKLSLIVGRDTSGLDMEGVRRAAIETLSENASDGIIAPLFYFAIGGLPLALIYKAVNTLDSMVGYRNEKYLEFGWASARLDDLMNYIPSRLTGLLITLSARFVSGADAVRAMKIMRRDGRKHKSPNAGVPEAAMAGALGVRLGGPSYYGGELVDKPYIGDDSGAAFQGMTETALSLVRLASLLAMTASVLVSLLRTSI